MKMETAVDSKLKRARELAQTEKDDNRSKAYFVLEDGLLYRMFQPNDRDIPVRQLVVPQAYRKSVLELAHEGIVRGHQGIWNT